MTIQETLRDEIIANLADNFRAGDEEILGDILEGVIDDALLMSNRKYKAVDSDSREAQIIVLASNIKKAVKTIYLQRGVEDVRSNSQSGLSNTYDVAMETMLSDIIRQNKRLMI